jgi:hypothetical protein
MARPRKHRRAKGQVDDLIKMVDDFGGQDKHRRLIVAAHGTRGTGQAVGEWYDMTNFRAFGTNEALPAPGEHFLQIIGEITGPRWRQSQIKGVTLDTVTIVNDYFPLRDLCTGLTSKVGAIIDKVDAVI